MNLDSNSFYFAPPTSSSPFGLRLVSFTLQALFLMVVFCGDAFPRQVFARFKFLLRKNPSLFQFIIIVIIFSDWGILLFIWISFAKYQWLGGGYQLTFLLVSLPQLVGHAQRLKATPRFLDPLRISWFFEEIRVFHFSLKLIFICYFKGRVVIGILGIFDNWLFEGRWV